MNVTKSIQLSMTEAGRCRGFREVVISVLMATSLLFGYTASFAAETVALDVVSDTFIRADLNARANDNYGCDPLMHIGTNRSGLGLPWGAADAMRTFLQFDVSAVPDKPLLSATLEMTLNGLGGERTSSLPFNVDVHRIVDSGTRTPWAEGNGSEAGPLPSGCSGVDAAYGLAWVGTGDGGDANNQTQPDFDSTVIDTVTLPWDSLAYGDIIQWDVTSLVQGWIKGDFPNFGMLLRDVTTDDPPAFRGVSFLQREAHLFGFAGQAPRLVLTFGSSTVLACDGFEPPLDAGPVTLKKNRALPLKARLLDADSVPVPGADLSAAPVIQVTFVSRNGGDPVDVTDEAIPVGLGTEGNTFVTSDDDTWRYNLKTSNFDAPGTYEIAMVTGDLDEYVISPTCTATFVIR